jgi:hypothetical protein
MPLASGLNWCGKFNSVKRPPIVAWVHARYARFLAVSGDGAGAQEQYLDAIERASTKEMFDEAAEWLYALPKVRWMYGMLPTDEQADEHSLARALRPHAKPSTLPGSQHTGELALGAMADETTPHEALQRCRLWRWQAVVRADRSEESHAVKGMGTLQERQGDIETAIQSDVRAGSVEKAVKAARNLPELRPHLEQTTSLLRHRRAAAYAGNSRRRRFPGG